MSYPEVKISVDEHQRQNDIAKKYHDLTNKIIRDHLNEEIALKSKGLWSKTERDRIAKSKKEKLAACDEDHLKELIANKN